MPAFLPLARARDKKKIKRIFGTEIYEMLLKVKLLRKGGFTSFLVPNPKILENCQLCILEHRREMKYKRCIRLRRLCKNYTKININKQQRRVKQRMKQKSRANDTTRISSELSDVSGESAEPSDLDDLNITDPYLDLVPKKIFRRTRLSTRRITYGHGVRYGLSKKSPHFPSNHPLESLDATGLFNNIMCNCPSAQPCLPLIKPYLTKLIMNHKSFKYFHIIQNFSTNFKGPYESQLTEHQLNRFFSMVVFKVSPQGLFGHRGNLKFLRSGLLAHIKSVKRRYFLPDVISNKFDLRTITWLKPINDDKVKKLMINKLIEWFIKVYGMAIVTAFLASNRTTDSSQRIFFPIMEMRKQTDNYINNLLDKQVLKKTFYDESNEIPVAIINLYLKSTGRRLVYQAFPADEQHVMLKTLTILLEQFNATKYRSIKPRDLHNAWKPFALKRQQTPIFYVTCDVVDAFQSVDHKKLSNILDDLFEKLPDTIPYETFYCLTSRRHQYSTTKNFIHESLPLTFPNRSLVCQKPRAGGSVPKQLIRDKLQEFIDNQLVIINEQCYKIHKGVGQGLSLSRLFAEIYYGKLMEEKFSEFQKFGTCVRYVDDYLYLTNHRVAAERFFSIVKDGIADYNCNFKMTKTCTNLAPISKEKFTFLGFEFNTLTGEVLPLFSELPSQHNMTISTVRAKNEERTFKTKMMSFDGLKLLKLILDPEINSKQTILTAFSLICGYTAQRCLMLCIYLINPGTFSEEMVFKIIHWTIDKLMRIYYTQVSKEKLENLAIRLSIWQVYVSVLRKNSMTVKKVVPLLQEKVYILKKKFKDLCPTTK